MPRVGLRQRGAAQVAALVHRLEAAGEEGAFFAHIHHIGRVARERLYPAARVVEAGEGLQQRPGVGVLGAAEQRYHVGVFHQAAAIDYAHLVGHGRHHSHVVGYEQD